MGTNYKELFSICRRLVVCLFLLMHGDVRADVEPGAHKNGWESGWQRLQDAGVSGAVNERIRDVNNYFNRIPRVSDQEVWGRGDYWASVTEFLQQARGDCEDFAIAKYYTLRKLGIPDDNLQLAYGKILNPGRGIETHMVLLYLSADDGILVLDNVDPRIRSLAHRTDLIIQYSFNGHWLWNWSEGNRQTLIGSADAVPQWKSMRKANLLPS